MLEILQGSHDGMSGRQLEDVMVDAGHGRNAARDARKYAVKNGHVITVPGRARAVIHKLPPESVPARHSAPVGVAHHAGESGEECASAPIEGVRTLTTAAPVSETESAPAHLADLLGAETIEESET
jgi:hypothetical protein